MKKNKILGLIALSAIVAFGTAGCGKSSSTSSKAVNTSTSSVASAEHPQKVLIGIRQDLFPTSYIDEKGNPSGYDIEIAKKIDELLPQYEFEYEAVSQEALLTGLETGKYSAAVAGFYSNDDRRKKYLFPQECIGGNIIGLLVRNEDSSIKTLENLHDSGKTLAPIATTSGMYGIIVEYNKEHPDKQIKLVDSDWTDVATEYQWISDGRYDSVLSSKNVNDETIKKLGLQDKLTFNSFTAIKTWSLFNPKETELAAAYDKALKELKEDGFVSQTSTKYFGEDIMPYIEK